MEYKKYSSGMTLIEVMVASVVLLIIAIGAASVIPLGFRSNQISKDQAVANQAVSKIMEQLNALTFAEITTTASPEPEYPNALIDTRNYTYPSQKVTINGQDYPRKLTVEDKSYRIDMLVYKGKHDQIVTLPNELTSPKDFSLAELALRNLLIAPAEAGGGGGSYTCTVAPPGTYYTGTAIQFSSTTNITGSGKVYAWDFAGEDTSTSSDPSHTFNTAGTQTVSLTITKGSKVANCTGEFTIIDAPSTPTPTPATTTTPPPGSVDVTVTHADGTGDNNGYVNTTEFKFEATNCQNCGASPIYRWNFGAQEGPEVTGNPITHIFTSAGATKTVTLSVEGGSGASQSSVVNLTTSDVTIAATPGLSGTVGQQFTFTATCNSCGTDPTYQWDFGDYTSAPSSDNTATYVFTQADSYIVTVTITGGSNPTGTTSVQISGTYASVIDVSPSESGIAGPDTDSETTVFTYNAKSSGFTNAVNYVYTFGGSPVISNIICPDCATTPPLTSPVSLTDNDPTDSSYPSVTLTYPTGGNYTVQLDAVDGVNSATLTGNVNLASIAVIDAAGDSSGTTTVEEGETVNFDAMNSKGVGPSVDGAWLFGDGNGDSGPTSSTSHSYSTAGSYTVTLNITGGSNPSTTKVITVVPPESESTPESNANQHQMKKIFLKVAPWSDSPPKEEDYISTFVFLKAENKEP